MFQRKKANLKPKVDKKMKSGFSKFDEDEDFALDKI